MGERPGAVRFGGSIRGSEFEGGMSAGVDTRAIAGRESGTTYRTGAAYFAGWVCLSAGRSTMTSPGLA